MIFFVIWIFIVIVAAIEFPPGINLCHRSDPNFLQCLANSISEGYKLFKNGNKDFEIPKIEPLFVEKMEIGNEPHQYVSLHQKYTNVYVYGFSDVDLTSYFEVNLDKCTFSMDLKFPYLRMEADYEINGKLLLFVINAKGKCNITQYNSVNRHTTNCEKYIKNNEIYLRAINYTINMNPESIHFDFGGVFLGHEQINAELIRAINKNSRMVFNQVKKGFEEIFSILHMHMMNNIFSRVPINKVFLD